MGFFDLFKKKSENNKEAVKQPPETNVKAETVSKEEADELTELINKVFPGLTMYVRDVNLKDSAAQKYVPEMFIAERRVIGASCRVMGMKTTHRFSILSNHMTDMHDAALGLFTAAENSHFKVLDVYKYRGKTQILLLHLPDTIEWKKFINLKISLEDGIIEDSRKRFEAKCCREVIPELADDEWLGRCKDPIGMNSCEEFFDLDVELNKMLKSVKDANFFQAFDRKFVFIQCNNKFIKAAKEFFEFESYDNGLLVYGYIDESGEAVFRVLAAGNIWNNKFDITVIAPQSKMAMRRIEINNFEFLSLDYCEFDTSIFEGVVREISDKHYNMPGVEAVRGLRFIDSLRSQLYPDNIMVLVECEGRIIDKFSIKCISMFGQSEIVGIVSTEPKRDYVREGESVNVKMAYINKTAPVCIYSVSKAKFEAAKQTGEMGLPVFYSGYYRWQEADTDISVKVPIGENVFGEGYYFDAKYGEVGINVLITGCPGSGKTEALYTWILSMAMCYSPKDVSFVLLGELSGELNKLPHMANVIHWVHAEERVFNRVTKQLCSEFCKRHTVIHKHSCHSIMEYNKMCKNNPQLEKLPYLYVVLDDIDSIMHLKSSENFLALLRVRGLGIQFICTAQSENLLSENVLWHFDSKWHMGSCNYFGAELKSPGNAIINGENVHLFYTGVLSAFANPIHYNKKQRSATMQAIKSCASHKNYSKNKPVITDFLPEKVDFEDVISKWEKDDKRFAVPFGIADDVEKRGFPAAFADFSKNGHMAIFGETGSGKTTLLQTIITSICELYSEEEASVFVMDFEMGAMKVFQKSPNVVDVAYLSEEEKIKGIINRLEKELNTRKELLDNAGVGSLNEYKNSTGEKLPYIVLAIDNFVPMLSLYPEMEKDILDIARYGAACGIYLILTASTPSELTYRIKMFAKKNSIALHMADRTEYHGIVGKTEGLEPAAVAGRGLIKLGKKILEFQSAYIKPEDRRMKEC